MGYILQHAYTKIFKRITKDIFRIHHTWGILPGYYFRGHQDPLDINHHHTKRNISITEFRHNTSRSKTLMNAISVDTNF